MTDRLQNLLGVLALLVVDELRDGETRTGPLGMTARAALVAIGMYPGCSIETLRVAVDLSHPAAVRAVASLVEAGFVAKSAGNDNRSVALTLSKTGRAAVKNTLKARERTLNRVINHLEPRERAVLEGLLVKVLWHETRNAQHAVHMCRLCDDQPCVEAGCPVDCKGQGQPMPGRHAP